MSDYAIHDTTLTAIANAIRKMDGTSGNIATENMATKIESIPTGTNASTISLSYTEIGNDDEKTGMITFSDDYHNYPILKFTMYNTSTEATEDVFATPRFIDDAFEFSSNKANFNFRGTTTYAYYQLQQNGSWKRGSSYRNCMVIKVYGVGSTTHDIQVTNIYRYQAISTSNREITFDASVYDYQYLLIGICDGDSTETQPSLPWGVVGNSGLADSLFFPYYGYGSSTTYVFQATAHTFSALNTQKYGFFTVDGVNFTPKSTGG